MLWLKSWFRTVVSTEGQVLFEVAAAVGTAAGVADDEDEFSEADLRSVVRVSTGSSFIVLFDSDVSEIAGET